MPKCDTCGKFMRCEAGASWALRFSGYPPTPDNQADRCLACTKLHGPIEPDHRTKPELTSGVYA